jgi:L-iditol 2-dehydrogenase
VRSLQSGDVIGAYYRLRSIEDPQWRMSEGLGSAMKAIVIERPNEIAYRDVEEPSFDPDDVLIRSHKAGLCATDLEVLRGKISGDWVSYPCIPGHEWSGTVAEVGANVTDLAPGDRVVSEGNIPCHRCRRCRNGDTNLCEYPDLLGFTRGGGCAELVVAPRHVVHRLPDSVSFDAAVLIEPASCVLRAMERVRPIEGETIGVVGIGTLGSIAIRLGRLFGPRAIVAYGIRAEELEFARRMGATHAINVAQIDAQEATVEAVGKDGLDVVVETAGAPQAVATALDVVRTGGRVGLLGLAGAGRNLELLADKFVLKDVLVAGTFSYTTSVWTRVAEIVASGLVDLDPIVTHRFPMNQFSSAYSLMEDREGIVVKILLEHASGA